MLKKTITFEDLDGNQLTEDFYFSLTKVEIAEMGVAGFEDKLKAMLASNNIVDILAEFKKIISMSVGQRSEDGRRFIKTPQYAEEFMQTDAFGELFMELATDETGKKVEEFFKAVIPSSMSTKLDEVKPATDVTILPVGKTKPWMTENREPTPEELRTMSKDDLVEVMQRKGNS